jgi:hypothetical protein
VLSFCHWNHSITQCIDLLVWCYLLLLPSFLLLDLLLLRLHRLVVLRHLHIRLLDFLLFHLLFITFFNISLDAVIDGFDILLDIVEEANQFEMNFIEHDEADY